MPWREMMDIELFFWQKIKMDIKIYLKCVPWDIQKGFIMSRELTKIL